jgi:hypothetical protein
MKVTYTSEDGTTFEREEDCLAYEATSSVLKQIFEDTGSEAEKALGFEDGFLSYFLEGFYCLQVLMRYRRSFLRLAELLQPIA